MEERQRDVDRKGVQIKGAAERIKKHKKKWMVRMRRNQDRLRNSNGNRKSKIPKGRYGIKEESKEIFHLFLRSKS